MIVHARLVEVHVKEKRSTRTCMRVRCVCWRLLTNAGACVCTRRWPSA